MKCSMVVQLHDLLRRGKSLGKIKEKNQQSTTFILNDEIKISNNQFSAAMRMEILQGLPRERF